MKKTLFLILFTIVTALTFNACLKDFDAMPDENDNDGLKAVISLKSGNMIISDTAEVNVVIAFSAENSIGATGWTWNFGDNSSQSNQEIASHKYTETGIFTVWLWVWNNSNQTDSTSMDIVIVDQVLPGQTVTYLNSASLPNNQGKISYEIAVSKTAVPNWVPSGNYFYTGDFTNNWSEVTIVDTTSDPYYAFFTISTYNAKYSWAYGRGANHDWADMTGSEFYNTTTGTLTTTFYSGSMLNQTVSPYYTPGAGGDTTNTPLLRIDISDTQIVLYFNDKNYAGPNINNPWATYQNINEQWLDQIPQIWIGGTGWGKVVLNRALFPDDLVRIRFGGDATQPNTFGDMQQSYYYDSNNNCLTFQIVDMSFAGKSGYNIKPVYSEE